MAQVPTEAVAICCLATAALAALVHVMTEQPVWNLSPRGWLSVLALGLGPVGLAFFAWNIGMKRGNLQFLGTAAYAAPLLSTFILVVAGAEAGSVRLVVAAGLIALGTALAAGLSFRRQRSPPAPDR